MMLSKFSFLLILLLPFQLTLAQPSNPTYITHVCPTATAFTPNSTFATNLNALLSLFSTAATAGAPFHYAAAGNQSFRPDTAAAYGLYLCRGDTTPKECQDCVNFAASHTAQHCPNRKTAVIWFDRCMVRYSNRSSFSVQPDTFVLCNNTTNATKPDRFNQVVTRLMREIIAEAAAGESKKFATKSDVAAPSRSVYAMAQCTNDLSGENCDRCLRTCLSCLLPSCSNNGKQGGRVLLPSCNIRYEPHPFYRETTTTEVAAASPELEVPAPAPVETRVEGDRSGISSGAIIAAIGVPVAVFMWIVGGLACCFINNRMRSSSTRKKLKLVHNAASGSGGDPNGRNWWRFSIEENEITNAESLQFDLATIEAATSNYDPRNKLGQGGFGEVYRGTLITGEEIAVKRLSKSSGQGEEEFKNEVLLVAKLQHKNLVRLLGFCLEGDERILVYEFVPNKSLDHFLYAEERKMLLNWPSRHQIILGIVRGTLYLHEDSRLKIIHRDLKASNILLDKDMKPKISDFGMARIFGVDQTQANTNRIVGTLLF
ncbi:unnamed protein product [Linum trigynum]|uniref:Cysteine-rich receptor-like protein kinase 25 n=1 Tax=Linum trigynum TaxID=586398 RepID=A0AAV2FJT8_9ROSI